MFSSNTTFIGVDPTAGEKPMVYAAINQQKHLLALGEGTIDDVLAFVAGQRQALVGVCAPRRPNIGLMRNAAFREKLAPAPTPGRWENSRVAEYLLRQRNIFIPLTSAEENDCPRWMQMGFRFYRRLEKIGYKEYDHGTHERMSLEVYPHAVFSALLTVLPFPKHTLEGRIQRQLVLFECDLDLPNPMDIFNEITRHRLLKGILPIDSLFRPGELDAIAAAFTSLQCSMDASAVSEIGDQQEGQIVIPVKELKTSY